MEEIDIIELLQRVKEGKAPKFIEVNRSIFTFIDEEMQLAYLYKDINNDYWGYELYAITLDTKIKILDKSTIEELKPIKETQGIGNDSYEIERMPNDRELMNKINEIIKWINNKE